MSEDPNITYLKSRGYMGGDGGGSSGGGPGLGIGLVLAIAIGVMLYFSLASRRQTYYEPSYIGACSYGPGWRDCGRG